MNVVERLHMASRRGDQWLKSQPLVPAELRGHVVLVNSESGDASVLAWDVVMAPSFGVARAGPMHLNRAIRARDLGAIGDADVAGVSSAGRLSKGDRRAPTSPTTLTPAPPRRN